MKAQDFLPIGSIVQLLEFNRRLMITGILQYVKERPDKCYDYLGVLYPEGDVGNQFHLTFNQDDIKEVLFRGYEDSTRDQFLLKLDEMLSNKLDI